MAKKSIGSKTTKKAVTDSPASMVATVKVTPVRNTPIPRAEPVRREISHEMIAKRAYEIYISGSGGTADENWARAERELRGL